MSLRLRDLQGRVLYKDDTMELPVKREQETVEETPEKQEEENLGKYSTFYVHQDERARQSQLQQMQSQRGAQ